MSEQSSVSLPPTEPSTKVADGGQTYAPRIPVLSRGQAALILTGIMLGILLGALDNLVVVTALPQIVTDLNQRNGVPFVVTSYLIAATIATPIFGRLSDIYSRRNFFLLGLGIFMVGSVLAGLAQSLPQLIAFRAIQGFGSGAFFPIGLSMIAVLFSPQTRARLTGVFSSIFGIATILGPFVGSYIVDHTTWRWVFYVNLPIGVAAVIVVLLSVGLLRPTGRKSFDSIGSALLAGWVGAFMFALFQTSQGGWALTDPRVLGLFVVAAAMFVAFVQWELRTAEPVVPLRFFAKRVIAASSGVAFLRGAVMITVTTFLSIIVAFVLGGNPDAVRNTLYWFVVPLIIGSAVGGQLLVRVAYRPLTVAGMAIMALGVFFLTTISANTSLWDLWNGFLPTGGIGLYLIPLGFGIGLTFAVTTLSIQYAVPPKDIGSASSFVQFFGNLGGAVGLSILTSYQQARQNALDPIPPGVSCPVPPVGVPDPACLPYYSSLQAAAATSYAEAFVILLGISIAAVVFALFLTGRLPRTRATPGEASLPPSEIPGPRAPYAEGSGVGGSHSEGNIGVPDIDRGT